jgi:hypothetical protein
VGSSPVGANNTTNNPGNAPSGSGGTGTAGGGGGGQSTDPIYDSRSPLANPPLSDYLFGSRYVGYQPEITLLDIGTTLFIPSGSVTVSPDRRYVMMQLSPYFNTIRGANEYNLNVGTTATASVNSDNAINDPMRNRGTTVGGSMDNTNTNSGGQSGQGSTGRR